MSRLIPVALFAYARPELLRRTLDCLCADKVPLIYAFSDGPSGPDKETPVQETREILRAVDWCELVLCAKKENLGLGKSILRGIGEVLAKHDALIVFEDDIECSPGTYDYLRAVLRHYVDDPKVMSVSAWTHPRVRPPIPEGTPYFDGRFACWGWGTWRRAWDDMGISATALLRRCRFSMRDVNRYGIDIPEMARDADKRNLWAVRFCLQHMLKEGLCFHPPHSLARHIGFTPDASDAREAGIWAMDDLLPCPPVPETWPYPEEHPMMPVLWRSACGSPDARWQRLLRWMGAFVRKQVYRWSVICDPEGIHSVSLRRAIADALSSCTSEGDFDKALDYGCGTRPYEDLIARVVRKTIAVDVGVNGVADCIASCDGALPFADGSMDLVTSFQVLEHVDDYAAYLHECARVCRDNGVLLLSAPSVWPYHPHPKDLRRWTQAGLEADLEKSGFRVVRTWAILNPVSSSIQYLLAVVGYMCRKRGVVARVFVHSTALFLNILILLTEKCFRVTLRLGAGNYLVHAVREGDDRRDC